MNKYNYIKIGDGVGCRTPWRAALKALNGGEGGSSKGAELNRLLLRMVTADGIKDFLYPFFPAIGTLGLWPDGSNWKAEWRGWVESL